MKKGRKRESVCGLLRQNLLGNLHDNMRRQWDIAVFREAESARHRRAQRVLPQRSCFYSIAVKACGRAAGQ